jgi:hypothetical protein
LKIILGGFFMKTIKINEQQQQNLITFLDRVQIKGIQEATEYLLLVKIINEATEETQNNEGE